MSAPGFVARGGGSDPQLKNQDGANGPICAYCGGYGFTNCLKPGESAGCRRCGGTGIEPPDQQALARRVGEIERTLDELRKTLEQTNRALEQVVSVRAKLQLTPREHAAMSRLIASKE